MADNDFSLTTDQACTLRNSLWQASMEVRGRNERVENLLVVIGDIIADMQGNDLVASDIEWRIEKAAFRIRPGSA